MSRPGRTRRIAIGQTRSIRLENRHCNGSTASTTTGVTTWVVDHVLRDTTHGVPAADPRRSKEHRRHDHHSSAEYRPPCLQR